MRSNKALLNLSFRKRSEEGMCQSFTIERFGSTRGEMMREERKGWKQQMLVHLYSQIWKQSSLIYVHIVRNILAEFWKKEKWKFFGEKKYRTIMAWNTLGPWKVKRALTGSWHVQGPCTKLGDQRAVQGDLPIPGVLESYIYLLHCLVCLYVYTIPTCQILLLPWVTS